MTDINIEAEKILSGLECEVVFRYPETFLKLPSVSYYTLNEHSVMTADNEELIQEGSVQVDIWAKKPSECGELALKINTLMTDNGWTRQFSRDLKKENNIYHRTMRFDKSFICGDL